MMMDSDWMMYCDDDAIDVPDMMVIINLLLLYNLNCLFKI